LRQSLISIKVGHVVLLEERKGVFQDYLVLSVEESALLLGVMNLQSHVFKFIELYDVQYLFTNGIKCPETVDQEGTFKAENLIPPPTLKGQIFKRGDEVSFSYMEQGAELTVRGYYIDISGDHKDHCLISEKGTSVRRFWEVHYSMLTLISPLVIRP